MQEQRPSTTALVTARMRWIHTAKDPHPLLNDPLGERFSPAQELVALGFASGSGSAQQGLSEASIDEFVRLSPAYANVIVRSWYTENALLNAVGQGIGQYVLIGAGFDSYAWRRPEQAAHLEIYEVDHPATQGLKKKRLAESGLTMDDRLHFVSADLGRESLPSALAKSGFAAEKPAFLSWLGVTMYLTPEANRATLDGIASYCAPGSELVFSYVDQVIFDDMPAEHRDDIVELQQSVQSVGEPFVSGFHPDRLQDELRALGLELLEDLDDLELIERCDPDNRNQLRSSSISRIARVRVTGAKE